MCSFFESFNNTLSKLKLNQKQTNSIYELCTSMVKEVNKYNQFLIGSNNGFNSSQALDASTLFICKIMEEHSTVYHRTKNIKSNELYVPPKELALGVRWNNSKESASRPMVPRHKSCKFQYISITESVKSLFRRNDFRQAYFKYNDAIMENVEAGCYTNFNSGNIFKSNDLYRNYPESLQIEIATDDFEVCNGLGSKATLHKMCPVYFTIKNIPPEFSSKVDTIHICSLCYTDDLKTEYTDFDDIWLHVVKDISRLENGIDIGGGKIIRGTVCFFASDNLGSNVALGFVANFSKAHYYCRFCMCSREEVQSVCREIPEKIRTKETHDEHLAIIADSSKVDLKLTKGVVRDCYLNKLKYYHMIDNMVPDIMHDLDEGAIPFLMKELFVWITKEKIYSEKIIASKAQFFDYGFLNKKNTPSLIHFEKENLNQNASQLLCLFRRLPFMLYEKKNDEKLKSVWVTVTSLLRIVQIAYSTKIDEEDLINLTNHVEIHLENYVKFFNRNLRFKQHNMIHYARIIPKMGPIKWMAMKRIESKHQDLKNRVSGKNFINLPKSICESHQNHIATVQQVYTNQVIQSGQQDLNETFKLENKDLLEQHFNAGENINEMKKLKYNGIQYCQGLFVHSNNSMYKILKILDAQSNIFFFCSQFDFVSYDDFLNSIKISQSEPNMFNILSFENLNNKEVYESCILNEEFYIILDTLALKTMYRSTGLE